MRILPNESRRRWDDSCCFVPFDPALERWVEITWCCEHVKVIWVEWGRFPLQESREPDHLTAGLMRFPSHSQESRVDEKVWLSDSISVTRIDLWWHFRDATKVGGLGITREGLWLLHCRPENGTCTVRVRVPRSRRS